jgi:hypothetical protein
VYLGGVLMAARKKSLSEVAEITLHIETHFEQIFAITNNIIHK